MVSVCLVGDGCPASSFECQNGQCISVNFYCDFTEDCDDGSDEASCGKR